MLATDGVFLTEPLTTISLGGDLGQWEYKIRPDMFVVQPGIYWSSNSDSLPKTRGIPRSRIIDHRDQFERVWAAWAAGDGYDRPPSVSVSVTSFIGHRLALARNKPELAGRWLEGAYLEAPSPQDATQMAEEIRRELPHDWFTDTLVRRLATRVDDPALQADAEANIEARGHALLRRVRGLTITGVVLFLLALVLLWRLLRSARGPRVAEAPLPPLWRGLDGLGLFFRAAFAYLLMPATLVLLLPRTPGSTVAMGLLGGAPMIWWIRRYLHARGETLRDTFGLRVPEGQAFRVIGWGIVLLGLSMAGESLASMGLTALGVTSHWADGFLEDFLWGSPTTVLAGTIDGVVWAPIFEELAFRGLLYPTLRLRLPPWLAALLSAGLFGVAHGYGLQGFAAVTWSGMIWALGYERSRSLLPGMLAHAASNLMATGSFLLLLRF